MKLKSPCLFTVYILLLLCLISGITVIDGCKGKTNETDTYKMTGDAVVDGKHFAQVYCAKCHAFVPPDALTKNVWKFHTLPSMAHYLGIKSYLEGFYKPDTATSGIALLQYQDIAAYYMKMAPDTLLPAQAHPPLANDWAGFTLKTPAPATRPAYTTMVAFNPFNHKIYTSDYISGKLTEWDTNLKPEATTNLPSTAVSAIFKKDQSGVNHAMLTCIGRIEPIDFPDGRVVDVNLDSKDSGNSQTVVASDLSRPVQTVEGDFNKDGLTDVVILGQGNLKGGVYLFSQKADHSYIQTDITDRPGAVQAVTGDFNNDGWPDLMILYGTGDEGLWLYLNDHKGGFTSRNLLHFPPVYGSTSFQLADLDHDGKPDLIYTCGYNFRDSRILKPYHGLYIFKNMGNWNFKQKWFYPVNGCTKAIAADFDGDGDLDIATIAFFADMKSRPSESFIYFEQFGPFNFKPHAIPISNYGHWMAMNTGDYNGDGKPDIILGNYSEGFLFQPGFKPAWGKNLPFVVLQNNFKK